MAEASFIDRIFDRIDNGIDAVDRVVNRHKHAEDKILETKSPSPKAVSSKKQLATVSRFRVEEVMDATTGEMVFVVTDGQGTSCDCTSREIADRILQALEEKTS